MRHCTISIFILLLYPLLVPAQTSTKALPAKEFTARVATRLYKLGDGYLTVKIFQYGDSGDLFFINLHDDEITAVSGAKRVLEQNGGTLVKIENKRERNIRFKLNGSVYVFDPNRIFSRPGIVQTLNMFGRSSKEAIDELERFAKQFLKLLPATATTCIISLHNNTDGKFNVTSFLPGKERERDAKAVKAMADQDPDDLFLTTDSALFHKLKKEKFNAVWQNNVTVAKDGSLSVYCGEKNIRYLNCESEHGRLKQYADMITLASKLVLKNDPDIIAYRYKLSSKHDSIDPARPYDIYFGEKKVGAIQPADGQLEMLKTFPLYDNMDFFYFASGSHEPKIELRIDPTRARAIQDPAKAVIMIKVVP
jgi:hypothetical protein